MAALVQQGCGDAVGNPILGSGALVDTPRDGGARDAGDLVDATTMATVSVIRPTGSGSDSYTYTGDVPPTLYCSNAANWADADLERQLADQLVELRRGVIRCSNGVFDDLPPFEMPPALRCSARLHSLTRATKGYDASDPGMRMTTAGFQHGAFAERTVLNSKDPETVLLSLKQDEKGCANLTDPEFTAIGIGEYGGVWTFDFAEPP